MGPATGSARLAMRPSSRLPRARRNLSLDAAQAGRFRQWLGALSGARTVGRALSPPARDIGRAQTRFGYRTATLATVANPTHSRPDRRHERMRYVASIAPLTGRSVPVCPGETSGPDHSSRRALGAPVSTLDLVHDDIRPRPPCGRRGMLRA
jgi:hypothetical protein